MRKFCLVLCVAWVISGCKPIRKPHIVHIERPPLTTPPVVDRQVSAARVSAGKDRPDLPIVVVESPATTAPPPRDTRALAQILDSEVKDAYFAYDRHDLLPEARSILADDAAILKSILVESPSVVLAVEGHCDERGSAEYNLALGDLRARTARDFLMEHGVSAGHLEVISYGKERPQCTAQEESCRQKNRRAHIAAK